MYSRPIRSFVLFLTVLLPAAAQAQSLPASLTYATYNWETQRKRLPVSGDDAQLPALVLREFSANEFAYTDAQRKNLRLFSIDHRIIRVNTSEGIEQFNKIYVPVQDGARIVTLKARTISPRGEVVEVSEGNMKELKDDDGTRNYKIFALDGVEKGSEIEYIFMRERPGTFFGREYLQSGIPARDVTFELISPATLTFETRLYHVPAGAQHDTVSQEKRITHVHLPAVVASHDETFAAPKAELMRAEYKLAYNAARGNARLFTWADASQYIHGTTYTLNKDENKALDKLMKQLPVPAGADVAAKITAAEQYLKSNFNLDPAAEPSLTRIITTRNASEVGFTRLFAAVLRRLYVEHELVLTSDRSDAPFDEGFDSWNYLSNYAFYFPATKQYLAPARPDYRYGMIPAEWTANKGLFVKTVKLGTTESAVGAVRDIPTLTADESPNDLAMTVRFSPALDKTLIDFHETLGGYQAQPIQPFYSFIPEDKRTEVLQELVKSNVPNASFTSVKVTNGEAGLSALTKPFVVDAQVESADLLDRAGPKYLFKIGTLLGPQSELYQAEARQYDVENDFNRRYNRVITVELPAGYAVRNLQDLNVDVKTGPTAAPSYLFRSQYEQKGQTVTINITEYYREIRWPKKDFEAFRDVVNAAANFNKVVLVLEKKG
ncbi:DUF3857 domain-containing protein [Hymenobacter defluvii]|uniref:DUF3857 domain-containing protein n=1 Tax=Hymenobacter defluvii TaxID=2054411 RepID=A0ABS3TGZ3_9BACT|nr:DUF3857 domain-containing protein [Hymenobacter defluvii]MBO3272917.1 DUF3857 domain-containing protein [Hymenobacter defluvii]